VVVVGGSALLLVDRVFFIVIFLIVRCPSNRTPSTPDLVTAWTGVARSGVPQREAALEALVLPADR
jgi:hypothetical protein